VAHLEVEPRGSQLYVALTNGRLLVYDIELDGTLAFAEVGVHLRGTSLADFDFVRGHVPYRLVTENVYATSVANDAVYEYSFDTNTGELLDLPATPFGTGGVDPRTVSVHPYSEHLVVAHGNSTGAPALSVHALDAGGLIQAGVNQGAERNNAGLAFDPSGRRAYMSSNGTNGPVVVRYEFNAATGMLDPMGTTTSIGGFLWPPAVHPTGRLLAIPDTTGDELEVFSIDPQTGALTQRTSVPTGGIDPFRCVFDASGRFVFTAHIGSTTIAAHAINLTTGTLTPVAGSPFPTGIHPLVMSLSPDGRSMMIADTANAAWRWIRIRATPPPTARSRSWAAALRRTWRSCASTRRAPSSCG
jgi:6-phosphogluconolactonase (cycloisomerase 2 family)